MLPGPPTLYQSILNHPDRRRARPVVAAARRHRRGRGPGRADRAHARTSSASRRSSPATASPRPAASPRCAATTTTPRRSRTTSGRAIPGVEVRVVDDDGRRGAAAASRARSSCRGYNVMRGLLRRPRGHRRGDRRRRLAAHRRHRRRWTSAATSQITDRKKDMFIVGGFNAYPAEIENLLLAPPGHRPGRGGRRARRAHGRGRAWPSSSRAPERRSTPTRSSPGAARRWPTTRCPRQVDVVDALPLNAGRQGPQVRAARPPHRHRPAVIRLPG